MFIVQWLFRDGSLTAKKLIQNTEKKKSGLLECLESFTVKS